MATGDERVVTAKLPADLVARLDNVASSIERSKSWIIREALRDWLREEERRHELTKEAMRDFDEGRVVSHEDVLAMLALKKIQARTKD